MTQTTEQTAPKTSDAKLAEVTADAATWRYEGLFPDAQSAVNFTNAPPAQVAGQAVMSVREDGRTDLFLFR